MHWKAFFRALSLSLFSLFICNGCSTPGWVKTFPVSDSYFIGIGVAEKKGNPQKYRARARNLALSEMAASISVVITSESSQRFIQDNHQVTKDQFSELVQTRTEMDLSNYPYRLIDTYEDDQYFYAYYSLNRKDYFRIRNERLAGAISRARSHYDDAMLGLEENSHSLAIQALLDAFGEINDFVGSDLSYYDRDKGETVYVDVKILSELRSLLSSMSLKTEQRLVQGHFLQGLHNPLMFQLVLETTAESTQMGHFPFHVNYDDKGILLRTNGLTDGDGWGEIDIQAFMLPTRQQSITVRPGDTRMADLNDFLSIPELSFRFHVSGDRIPYRIAIGQNDFREMPAAGLISKFDVLINKDLFQLTSRQSLVTYELNIKMKDNRSLHGRFNYLIGFELLASAELDGGRETVYRFSGEETGQGRSMQEAVNNAFNTFLAKLELEQVEQTLINHLSGR